MAMSLVEVQKRLAVTPLSVILFMTKGHPPAQQMADIVEEAEEEFSDVLMLTIDVDEGQNRDLLEPFGVDKIPTTLLFSQGQEVHRVVGANPPEFIDTLEALKDGTLEETLAKTLRERLFRLSTQTPVVMFMKGSKANPFCKFSKAATALLRELDVEYSTFDVFEDEAVRQGMKSFSDWPTFPQIYIHGNFMGGLDVIREMAADGSLIREIRENPAA